MHVANGLDHIRSQSHLRKREYPQCGRVTVGRLAWGSGDDLWRKLNDEG
jgi:hypothetical protein